MRGDWYHDKATGETVLPFWLYALVYGTRDAVRRLTCWALGHRLVGDGHAGPDSGSDGAYCERCGYSWHVTLY